METAAEVAFQTLDLDGDGANLVRVLAGFSSFYPTGASGGVGRGVSA